MTLIAALNVSEAAAPSARTVGVELAMVFPCIDTDAPRGDDLKGAYSVRGMPLRTAGRGL